MDRLQGSRSAPLPQGISQRQLVQVASTAHACADMSLLCVLLFLPCSDGEDELYYNMLLEEDPWNKLQVQAVLSAVCLTASTVICWLCEKDPAGEQFGRMYARPDLVVL